MKWAYDDDTDTEFKTGNNKPHWMTIDLGKTRHVSYILYRPQGKGPNQKVRYIRSDAVKNGKLMGTC